MRSNTRTVEQSRHHSRTGIVREIVDSANGMATSSHQAVASRQLVYNMSAMDPEIPLRRQLDEPAVKIAPYRDGPVPIL
jgi:hypothetical protein